MAYMRSDTSAKVGFRPMHQTDPFGAAHLSGYGSGSSDLGDLGQGHNPFTPRAWQLHGLPPWRLHDAPPEASLGRYYFNRPFDPWELSADTAPGLHGLDLYAPSRFAVPTASSQRLQAGGNNPGGGTILLGGVDGSVWALQGVSLKDEIDHVRDEIAALVERARQAAASGDTITARTCVNRASAAAGTLQGLGNLPDQNTIAELEANGWDSGEVETLVALGASDEQLLALPYPASPDEMAAAFSALMAQLTSTKQAVRVSPGPAPSAPQPVATQPANRTPVPFLAAGTRLTYIAQWAGGVVIDSPATIASKIKPILSSTWGIEVDGESDSAGFLYTGSPGFTLQVHTTRDYGQASDIQHIIDGVVTNAGRSVSASQIGVAVQNATGPGLLNPGGAANFTQWFQSNWPWLAVAMGAVVVARPIAEGVFGGGRRR